MKSGISNGSWAPVFTPSFELVSKCSWVPPKMPFSLKQTDLPWRFCSWNLKGLTQSQSVSAGEQKAFQVSCYAWEIALAKARLASWYSLWRSELLFVSCLFHLMWHPLQVECSPLIWCRRYGLLHLTGQQSVYLPQSTLPALIGSVLDYPEVRPRKAASPPAEIWIWATHSCWYSCCAEAGSQSHIIPLCGCTGNQTQRDSTSSKPFMKTCLVLVFISKLDRLILHVHIYYIHIVYIA